MKQLQKIIIKLIPNIATRDKIAQIIFNFLSTILKILFKISLKLMFFTEELERKFNLNFILILKIRLKFFKINRYSLIMNAYLIKKLGRFFKVPYKLPFYF